MLYFLVAYHLILVVHAKEIIGGLLILLCVPLLLVWICYIIVAGGTFALAAVVLTLKGTSKCVKSTWKWIMEAEFQNFADFVGVIKALLVRCTRWYLEKVLKHI